MSVKWTNHMPVNNCVGGGNFERKPLSIEESSLHLVLQKAGIFSAAHEFEKTRNY